MSVFEEIIPIGIPGCFLIRPKRHLDQRGLFSKTFHAGAFLSAGLETRFREQFYSTSKLGVLRGLHFQQIPHEQAKLVYCIHGRILDAIVDVRGGTPGFGTHQTFELSADEGQVLYLAPGVAHGFYVLSDEAITVYAVTAEYHAEADTGVRWDSCGIEWPSDSPLVSNRDAGLPLLEHSRQLFGSAVPVG